MTGFISACLYLFAVCAALGLIPAAVLAVRERSASLAVLSLLVAAFFMFVLITAAGDLHG